MRELFLGDTKLYETINVAYKQKLGILQVLNKRNLRFVPIKMIFI